jgi:FSR family fosmidomycin resistance protein-like MFS transporter
MAGRSMATSWGVLCMYALAHAAVDACCAVLLWSAYHDGRLTAGTAWSAFLFYNLLAFAMQPLVGLAADRLRIDRGAAVAGALLTVAAMPLALVPGGIGVAVVVAGLGNAVFHVGGGIVSLRAAPGRATPIGVFVAPGAAGLAAGILAGKTGGTGWPFAVALLVLAVVLAIAPPPRFAAERPAGLNAVGIADSRLTPPRSPLAAAGMVAVVLLLVVIGIRSYVGLTLALPWKSELGLLIALTAAVVAGKALGGLLGDRLGWRPVAVTALLVSLPLLALGGDSPVAGIAGLLAFNLTMPVTLAAVAAMLPRGREGFAFGLTCLALFVGATPALAGWTRPPSAAVLAALVLPAAAALWLALRVPRPQGALENTNAVDAAAEGSFS